MAPTRLWLLLRSGAALGTPKTLDEVGLLASHGAPTAPSADPWWQGWQEKLTKAGKPLLQGALTFSVAVSAQADILVSAGWHLRVRVKRRRRLAARQ